MNRALLPLIALSLLVGLSSATSNTIFNEVGLPANTFWNINVYSYQTTLYNHNFNSSNTAVSGFIPTSYAPYLFRASGIISGTQVVILGAVSVAGNNLINFNAITTNTSVTSSQYNFCFTSGCVSYLGNPPNSASSLQSEVLGPPYSADLTIYLNPAGYFEYALSNSSVTAVPPTFYVDIAPGQLVAHQINLTYIQQQATPTLNKTVNVTTTCSFLIFCSKNNVTQRHANITYVGSVYYSQLIDISPVEFDMVSGNLTPYAFSSWVQNNQGAFYNTTLIYDTTNLNIIDKAVLALPTVPWYLASVAPVLLLVNVVKGTATYLLQGELTVPPGQAVSITTGGIKNPSYPLNVTYAYPNLLCLGQYLNGICTQSGIQGMLAFNNYFDNTYAPQVALSQFVNFDLIDIMLITLSIYLIKKLNGS
jgi:hypothetical protein